MTDFWFGVMTTLAVEGAAAAFAAIAGFVYVGMAVWR
jgi:hypothetical protein